MLCQPLEGWRHVAVTGRRTIEDFAHQMRWLVDAAYPEAEKIRVVLQRLAQRLADEYAPLLQGWPLQERVVFVTEVMHADGGFAEWAETERGYEIRDFNCLFHRLLEGDGEVCEWHRSFLNRMLGTEVRVSPCPDGADRCCRYLIEENLGVPAVSVQLADSRS